jgi:uncharacterized membrane protein YgcG
MSGDIEKVAIFDPRIIQSRPRYAVEKGALSLTNSPFNAIAASSSQFTFNIYVPSENVFVDRAVEWSATGSVSMSLGFSAAQQAAFATNDPLITLGRDIALAPFPLNSLCATLTATINDTTTVINSQDVLTTVLRLTDYKKNRLQRTCPTMLDKYQSYNDCFGAVNNPLAGYQNATDSAEMPNGAFGNVIFTSPDGQPLAGTGGWPPNAATVPPSAPQLYYSGFTPLGYIAVNGQPLWLSDADAAAYNATAAGIAHPVISTPAALAAAPGNLLAMYLRFTSTEKVCLSPFVFSDVHEWDTGLFGINNIQLIMNLRDASRLIRSSAVGGRNVSNIALYTPPGQTSCWTGSVLNVVFLTPSLDTPLPPKSVVPYMEFPRYITQYQNGQIAPGGVGQVISQTITLPQIPDLFIIFAKPTQYVGANGQVDTTQGDWYFPPATRADNVPNPLSVNFDNFSGLLSSVTTEELYAMAVKNGLDMDWAEWSGYAHSSAPYSTGSAALGGGSRIPTVGGFLVLKPSQDITLQTGQAPSLVGNFTFQFSLQLKNTSAYPQTPQLFVITANSGFFESIRGSSRIIKGVLSEQDIISAPLAPMGMRNALSRYVGGAMRSLGNAVSMVKDAMGSSSGSGSSGAGSSGAGMSGAGSSGAGSTGGKRGLHARLAM